MANIKIQVINRCNAVSEDLVAAAVPALRTQVHRDFAPVWGVDADLTFVPKNKDPDPGYWWLGIFDDSDQAGALGYHDLTQDGLPLGKVFAGTDVKYSYIWTVTASHELLEMLGDPDINLTAFMQSDAQTGIMYAYEVCDACEADPLGYDIGDVRVSDFVYPSWFESFRTEGSTQFDHGNRITKPFQLLPGGYIGAFDVGAGSGWHQITPPGAMSRRYDARPRLGSRRERRMTPRNHWLKSSIETRQSRTLARPHR